MRVIEARNVHEALPKGLWMLKNYGKQRSSRNGPVLQAPWPVTTVYERPWERVLFWSVRDANPFFHLYESLWMLAGRNDVKPLVRYAKQMAEYSDNGETLWGAYGDRWRKHFAFDQLEVIAENLQKNNEDRRQVLTMWDAECDLGHAGKDLPCNLTATFQVSTEGTLELTVFNRSNDIIWGAYGANAVHFSFLLEYMANWIGIPMGTYRQVSTNFHAYLDPFTKCEPVLTEVYNQLYATPGRMFDPYIARAEGDRSVEVYPIRGDIARVDQLILLLLEDADYASDNRTWTSPDGPEEEWAQIIWRMLFAHFQYKLYTGSERFDSSLETLRECPHPDSDWIRAGIEWINRRQVAWEARNR